MPLPDKPLILRFAHNSNGFTAKDLQGLAEVARSVNAHPRAVVVISGHSDSVGSKAYNYNLSLFRANMVKSYLLGKGIADGRLQVEAYGSEKPIAPNDTPEGRWRNRRVEVEVKVPPPRG